MLEISYHATARQELAEAGRFYSSVSPELGGSFFAIYDKAIADFRQFPNGFPKVEGDFRRYPLRRFPFGVCYRVDVDTIRILAFAHNRRHPDYWKRRK
jgi:toxin ParE1/3/4